MKCSICKQPTHLLEEYHDAPHKVMNVYGSDKLEVKDIELFYCENCDHSEMPSYITEDYYDDYSMGSFWGSSFQRVRKEQIKRLSQLAPSTHRFLDIGCGVGHYLELAKDYFDTLIGIEPSKSSAEIANQKGFEVIDDYFGEHIQFTDSFDVITLIEVLEHIDHPVNLLRQAAMLLNDGGIMLVEVPNGQRILNKRLYYNLCTDHIHYFSVSSLSKMAKMAGLTILCVQESLDPNLLEIYAKKETSAYPTFKEKRRDALTNILSNIKDSSQVAAWGAGAESVAFISMIDAEIPLKCIFDSNESKHGLQISGIPIHKPLKENVQKYDYIILFANAHKSQIMKQLEELGFRGQLITF